MCNMKRIFVILIVIVVNLMVVTTSNELTSLRANDSIDRKVSTYRVSLLTHENRYVTDVVTAENEAAARSIIRERYPNCIIYSVERIGGC